MDNFNGVGRRMAMYVCRVRIRMRSVGGGRFRKCPVCGIKWG